MPHSLQEFKDALSRAAHGMTRDEAHRQNICVACKKPIAGRIYTTRGAQEYMISAICEHCWDTDYLNKTAPIDPRD